MPLLSHSDIQQVSGGVSREELASYMTVYSFNSTLVGMSAFMVYALSTMHMEAISFPNGVTFQNSIVNTLWNGLPTAMALSWTLGAVAGLGAAVYNSESV